MKATDFIEILEKEISEKEKTKLDKFFKGKDGRTRALGVRFGHVFQTAGQFRNLAHEEINTLLNSEYYEVRMGAVSIMDFQAREKRLPEKRRKALFDLYLTRHDRLNNWDFVDRGAANIIGRYLINRPRDILYELAGRVSQWERRTAIVSTWAFIKEGQLDDTFNLAEILVHDPEELMNKAVGSWIREAGKRDKQRLLTFLDKHAPSMPRITLRYAIEKLSAEEKKHFMSLGKRK